MTASPVIQTTGLTKRYGEFTALDNLSISVDSGQILGFIGPNGAGKSTTIKILVGLLRPTEGTASIAGCDCVRDAAKIKRLVGYMPDQFGSYNNMRVSEYLDFFGAAYGLPARGRGKRIEEVLEITGASYMRDLFVESLSHGMKQRVAIARTMLHDPQVLILDEPANGLDPQARIEMRDILRQLAAIGKTLIVTSHILPELARICDTVAIITHGQLRAFGSQADIMRQVSQRRTFEIQLANSEQLSVAENSMRAYFGTDSKTEISLSETESLLRFDAELSELESANLLGKLVEDKILVAQFREIQTDLEDAFLSVTANKGPGGGSSGLDKPSKAKVSE